MISAYEQPVTSKSTVNFTEALAQNAASAMNALTLPAKTAWWFIRAITIVSVENLAWELWLFKSATSFTANVDSDGFIGAWAFSAIAAQGVGYPVAGNLLYRYYVDGNMLPYFDADQMVYTNGTLAPGVTPQGPANAKLHVKLVNRSAAAKTAGVGGAINVTFWAGTQGMQV